MPCTASEGAGTVGWVVSSQPQLPLHPSLSPQRPSAIYAQAPACPVPLHQKQNTHLLPQALCEPLAQALAHALSHALCDLQCIVGGGAAAVVAAAQKARMAGGGGGGDSSAHRTIRTDALCCGERCSRGGGGRVRSIGDGHACAGQGLGKGHSQTHSAAPAASCHAGMRAAMHACWHPCCP